MAEIHSCWRSRSARSRTPYFCLSRTVCQLVKGVEKESSQPFSVFFLSLNTKICISLLHYSPPYLLLQLCSQTWKHTCSNSPAPLDARRRQHADLKARKASVTSGRKTPRSPAAEQKASRGSTPAGTFGTQSKDRCSILLWEHSPPRSKLSGKHV